MKDLLENNQIIIGKPPASTTATSQPCDKGNCFKGPKTKLKKICDVDVSSKVVMFQRLSSVFKAHQEKYINIRQMSTTHINMAKNGLLKIQLALIISMRSDMIESSFKQTGIYPFDISVIFKNCKTNILPLEETNILSNLDNLVVKMKEQGEIFDSDFDEVNIRQTLDLNGFVVKKDDLVNYRRRSLMLTNINYIAREENKKNEKVVNKTKNIEKKKLI
jgi:ribosomal protein S6E (S10)